MPAAKILALAELIIPPHLSPSPIRRLCSVLGPQFSHLFYQWGVYLVVRYWAQPGDSRPAAVGKTIGQPLGNGMAQTLLKA